MGAVTQGLAWLIWLVNQITNLTLQYPVSSTIFAVIIFGGWYRKSWKEARTFIYAVRWFMIVDGLFWRGKTRFLTLLCQEAKKAWMIILSNFYNSSEDVRWNSAKDLILLMQDMWMLGEYQNYTQEDVRKMYESEGKKRVEEKINMMKKIAKKYPNIPHGWFVTKLFLAGDEIQNIFFNRNSMENFAGDRKGLLKLLHQIRHFNTLCAFALTDRDEIDRKFKRISSHYVSIGESINGLLMKYNVYTAKFDKDWNFDTDTSEKLTKVPATHFNGWQWNKLVVAPLEKLLKRRLPNFLKFLRAKELWFFSKFNADPDVDIYKPWMLFEYLEKKYANDRGEKYKNLLY